MFEPLRTLLFNIIDYAGLFPPAKLPLEKAMPNYLEYLRSENRWMIAKFVIPFSRIPHLDPYFEEFHKFNERIEFSILGRGGKDAELFASNLKEELKVLSEVKESENVDFPMMEIKVPESLFEQENPETFIHAIQSTLESSSIRPSIYLEVPFKKGWSQLLQSLGESLLDSEGIYFKVRTGGTEASLIPSIDQLAEFISISKSHEIPFKATAGLHHPFRHFSSSVNAKMHGYLNLLIGSSLDLEKSLLVEILSDEQQDNFEFSQRSLGWKGHKLSVDQIKNARRDIIHSYGSCSFEEPIEDLIKLGLW